MIISRELKKKLQRYFPVLLLGITFLVLYPSLNNTWVNWDDPQYVLENEAVKKLSLRSFVVFFSDYQASNYHPLTMLSLAVDYTVGGGEPFVFHLTNLLLHLANTLLLYYFVFKLLRSEAMAFTVAILFAVHPMHLESVAWVSQRKDLLYTCFFLLALLAYLKYRESQKRVSYLLCLVVFLLSLLSKGMAVVFPLILLLLDYREEGKITRRRIIEKTSFFILSLIAGVLAIGGQHEGGAIGSFQDFTFFQNTSIAAYGLLMYIIKAIVPFQLSTYHPYPLLIDGSLPNYISWSLLPLALILITVAWQAAKNRDILFGSSFFLLAVAPILQILAVGNAIMAERYTYLAYIGLFFALVVALKELLRHLRVEARYLLNIVVGGWIIVLASQTHARSSVWYNDESLWTEAIAAYPEDYFVYYKRARFYIKQQDFDLALKDLDQSLANYPLYNYALNDRGMILYSQGRSEEAYRDFSKLIEVDPNFFEAYLNRGLILMNNNQLEEALADFDRCIALQPSLVEAYINKGVLYEKKGEAGKALEAYNQAIKKAPAFAAAYKYRGVYYFYQSDYQKALADFEKALSLDPDMEAARQWRLRTLDTQGK
jgi:tetratricopeptide (TPR) repeat protein